jgi:uncharacterized membrane protein YphA (DoxX/SURF4 family)
MNAAQGLALVRISVGLYFLVQGWGKLVSNWLTDDQPMTRMMGGSPQNADQLYRPFLEQVVLPNALLFSQLVVLGELAAGFSLTLGAFTGLGSIAVMLMTANYMLMKGLANPMGSNDRMFFAIGLALFLSSAGVVAGLDGLIRGGLGRHPMRWLVGLGR